MAMPLVSIIVTTYNREAVAARAVGSALAQTFGDIEVIIVDDASTDNTLRRLRASFGDPRIKIIENPKNLGAAGAKNVGILAARGEYIAFLDSDDEWMPDKLERQLAAVENDGRFPLCLTAFYIQRRGAGRRILRVPYKRSTWLESLLCGESFSLGCTLLMHRESFLEVGLFVETLERMEDTEWMLRYLTRFGGFVFLAEPLACVHNTGWPNPDSVLASAEKIFHTHKWLIKQRGLHYLALFRAGLGFENAVACYRRGDWRQAIRIFAYIVIKKPEFAWYMLYRTARKIKGYDWA